MNTHHKIEPQKPKIVIVGAGFGGLRAAKAFAKAQVQVTIVDRNNYHLVSTSSLSGCYSYAFE